MTGGHLLLLLTGLAAHPRQVAPSLLSLLQQSADEPTAEVAALLATEDGVLALHIQTEEKSGNTPLHVAATRGWSQVTRLLAEAGADIEHTNAQQATPLVAATQQPPSAGQLGAISTLLEAGADVNAHPSEGHSALHICARDGNDALCATLLSAARVDPNIRTARELQRTFYLPWRPKFQESMLLCCRRSDATASRREEWPYDHLSSSLAVGGEPCDYEQLRSSSLGQCSCVSRRHTEGPCG